MSRPWAHPRAGGENPHQGYVEVYAHGSSPRGRGKHVWSDAAERVEGLIPARAGKTSLGGGQCPTRWAHPRAGGENELVSWELVC